MKVLYATVEVKLIEKNEKTEYFITKDNLYGVKIVRTEIAKNFENNENLNDSSKFNQENKREKVIKEIEFNEISNNENTVKSIIDMFIAESSDFEQMSYIIDDCIANQKIAV